MKINKHFIYFVIIMIFSIVLCGTTSATDIPVNNITGIQNAINTAADGDTLNLSAGTYNEHDILVNKNLTITGPPTTDNNPPTAVIDAQNTGRVFKIPYGVNVTLQYLLIQNGNATTDSVDPSGGGILNNGILNIKNCTITQNTAKKGGGIYNSDTCTVTNSTIQNNTANNGGGIYNGYYCTVTNSTIQNNTATQDGGGIYNMYYYCTVTNSTIQNNTANGKGGGIYKYYGDCTVTNSTIQNNTANGEGGGIYNYYGDCTVTNSTIQNNTANNGGGIYNSGTCTVTNSTIQNNTANNGGGISNEFYLFWKYNTYLMCFGVVTLNYSNINNNTAYYAGGGIYNFGTCTVTNSTIQNNTANGEGGGIYNNNDYGYNIDYHCCTVTNSTIQNNTANNGGGIYNGYYCTVTNSTIQNNTANNGGGIFNHFSIGVCVVNFCRITKNTANNGKDIYCNSGSVDASHNWWGSNQNPNNKIYGNVNFNPWLVLNLTTTTTIIEQQNAWIITADLTHDSNDTTLDPMNGHVPDGTLVFFTTTLGSINSPIAMTNGTAIASYSSVTVEGVANITAKLDNQNITTSVTVNNMPYVTSSDPTNNVADVPINQTVKITFSEPIKAGPGYDSIIVKNLNSGSTVNPLIKNINNNVLTLSRNSQWIYNNTYQVLIPRDAITDLAGYNLTENYTLTFKIDTQPYLTTSNPLNNTSNVPVNHTVRFIFNEPVQAGSGYNSITVKNQNTNAYLVQFTKNITGNILNITYNIPWAYNNTYFIYIPRNALTDLAGYNLSQSYNLTFKIDAQPSVVASNPLDNATDVPINQTTTIYFSEPVKAGPNYNNINVINVKTGDLVTSLITKNITGNTLTLSRTTQWIYNYTYQVLIPRDAITDLAGYNLTRDYSLRFTIDKQPTVNSSSPNNNAVNVPINQTVKITFSEPIKAGPAYDSIIVKNLNSGSTVSPLVKNINNNVLTLSRNSQWIYNNTYQVLIPRDAITDLAGYNLTQNYTLTFKIDTQPYLTTSNPLNNTSNVPVNHTVRFIFSEPIQTGTGYNSITIKNQNTGAYLTQFTKNITGNILNINYNIPWTYNNTYFINIPRNAITDLTGYNLTQNYNLTFKIDNQPIVLSSDPENGAINIPTNKIIKITFTEQIKAGNMWIELKDNSGNSIPINTTITSNVLTINHSQLLSNGKHTIILHTGSMTDLAGNPVALWTSTFTVDGINPTITSTDPVNGAVNVARDKVINFTFSEPIKAGNLWVELYNGSTQISLTPLISGNVLIISHSDLLAAGTKYTLCLHSGSITDLAGNPLALVAHVFTTSTDVTAPTVTSTDPVNNAVNVAKDKVIKITFNEPIKAGNLWIELYNGNTQIPINTSINGNILTITHTALLAANTKYTLSLHTGSVLDLVGNPLTLVSRVFITSTT